MQTATSETESKSLDQVYVRITTLSEHSVLKAREVLGEWLDVWCFAIFCHVTSTACLPEHVCAFGTPLQWPGNAMRKPHSRLLCPSAVRK